MAAEGGGRCVAGGACGWNGCCRPGNVRLLVRNEVRAEDLGKKWTFSGNYASRGGTVGAVGARLDGDWNHPQLEQLSTRKHVLVTVCSG